MTVHFFSEKRPKGYPIKSPRNSSKRNKRSVFKHGTNKLGSQTNNVLQVRNIERFKRTDS